MPFVWALVWGVLTVPYVRWAMHKETEIWENDQILDPERKLAEVESAPPSEPENTIAAAETSSVSRDQKSLEESAAGSPARKSDSSPETAVEPDEQRPSQSAKPDTREHSPSS